MFTFHLHIFPEQFPARLTSAVEHVYQTEAVGQRLHVGVLDTGRYEAPVDKGWKVIVALYHQGVGLQVVEDEIGRSLCSGLGLRPANK